MESDVYAFRDRRKDAYENHLNGVPESETKSHLRTVDHNHSLADFDGDYDGNTVSELRRVDHNYPVEDVGSNFDGDYDGDTSPEFG